MKGGTGREGGGVCTERNECLVHIGEALTLRVCVCVHKCEIHKKSEKHKKCEKLSRVAVFK